MISNDNRAAMSVADFIKWAGIGKTTFYRQVAQGKLSVLKVGSRTIVPIAEAHRWLSELPSK